jgi:ubiquinone/menaquinone biosynthesis C-methylase UbiE
MIDEGKEGYKKQYDGDIPESVLIYTLPPLIEAASVFNANKYTEFANNCLDFYKQSETFLNPDILTHFLAYELEALIDMDKAEMAKPLLEKLASNQNSDGSVKGKGKVNWVCSTGLAQIAICWYKTGYNDNADKAMEWLDAHQNKSGGFYGSYGKGASYFAKKEISWAVKFYLDANLHRIQTFFNNNYKMFPDSIIENDGRLKAILSFIKPGHNILDAGCGKGRFLKQILNHQQNIKCTGLDISESLLSYLPENIPKISGKLENIPCKDNTYNIVYSVEALEHSLNPVRAIEEMVRVAKPGGQIIIIDKQASKWGKLKCQPWEFWPEKNILKTILNQYCDNVSVKSIAYDNKPSSDGLMLMWSGQKRTLLSAGNWHDLMVNKKLKNTIVEKIKSNYTSEWAQEIILNTNYGDKVLEIGSGTGEISLQLALTGRNVSLLDISNDSLNFAKSCAKDLSLDIKTFTADATKPLPFEDNAFDCVWHSGLLEHFSKDERIKILSECKRVTSNQVITLVPNASCLAYSLGKKILELNGKWAYGIENPILTLKDDYESAGLKVVREYSIGIKHALNFLEKKSIFRKELSKFIDKKMFDNKMNQGYLLITIGKK